MGENGWEKAVVDRIVDGVHAVLLVGEDEREHIVPAALLPPGVAPGTWLKVRFDEGNLAEAVIDEEETRRARERISGKLRRLRERGRRL